MKTFLDTINQSNDLEVLKHYVIHDTDVYLKAGDFKLAIDKNTSVEIINKKQNSASLTISLERQNNSIIIKASECCPMCNGTGEVDCDICYGTGDCICPECEARHECRNCEGYGVVKCECENYDFDRDSVILVDKIDLNQGDLFNN